MKVSAVISKPSIKLDNTNKSAIISGVILASGVVVGCLLYIFGKVNFSEELLRYFIDFTTVFSNKNKPEIISGLILQNISYYVLMMVFGSSVLGVPAVFSISFIKAVGLGVLTTYIYESFMLKGIEYCLLVFFPGKFFLIFAMLLLTQNCSYMSINIMKSIKNSNERGVDFKKFSLRSLFILVVLLVANLIDFIAIISFSSLFEFA